MTTEEKINKEAFKYGENSASDMLEFAVGFENKTESFIKESISDWSKIDFINGALSPEAKEHWQQGMYTEAEVYDMVERAVEYGYKHGLCDEKYNFKQWFDKNKLL